MKYQDLRKNGETIAHTSKIEVLEQDGVAYKLFDKSFSRTQIFYEAMLQTKAEEQGIRVPKIYGVERIDDRLAILSEYIEGQTVQELMEENPAKKDYYLKTIKAFGTDAAEVYQIFKKAGIDLNRKSLSEIAIADSAAFAKLVETAKSAL